MKVAILGSGNGALAMAFEWARAGHDIYMYDFPQFDKQIQAINAAGGIYSEGQMEGFQKVAYAGHDIALCLKDAPLVFAVGPAYSTEPFGKACAPYAEKGQIYVVCPSSCMGAILFKKSLGLSIEDNSIIVSDTSTLPYAVRIIADGKIAVYNRLGGGCLLATLPSSKNDDVYDMIKPVHPCIEKGKNIFQTCLQNANPMLHPCITTLNAARIEGPNDFFFYEEGVTPGVGRLMKAIDDGDADYDFVEVMACPGGCAGGGGQPIHEGMELAAARGKDLWKLDAKSEIRFSHENPDVMTLYHEYFKKPLGEKAHHLLHTDHDAWQVSSK
mgnify:CR=1 FL=1